MGRSCNGCRVLRKWCSEDYVLRPCLEWINSPHSQANATVLLAKFYGRAGLFNLIRPTPLHHRPVDLFISKKSPKGIAGGSQLRFTNAGGDLLFKFDLKKSHQDQSNKRFVFDAASGNPLVSIVRIQKGSWQVFREDNNEDKQMIYKVERTVNSFSRIEFEVFVMNGDIENPKSELKIKGSPFHRSCTIYKGDTIVAQTSLMYKLGIQKVFVPRNRFRLTIFPGFPNHAAIVALIVIFFDGRKLWI